VELTRARPEIDADRVFLAGHNLGGFLAPSPSRSTQAAGLLLLAPVSIPVSDWLEAQSQAFLDASPDMAEDQRALFEEGIQSAARLEAGTFTSAEILFNLRGAVWKELQELDPAAQLREANRPFAILFAGSDFLVPEESHAAWRRALGAQEMQGTIVELPGLNHAFVRTGEEDATPESPFVRGNVDEQVIRIISEFVKKGRLPS